MLWFSSLDGFPHTLKGSISPQRLSAPALEDQCEAKDQLTKGTGAAPSAAARSCRVSQTMEYMLQVPLFTTSVLEPKLKCPPAVPS